MAFALFRTESNQRINCPIRTNTQRFCLARVLHYQPAPHHPGTQQEPRFFGRSARQGGFAERKAMINRSHDLPITKQAKVLNVSRGSVYYLPRAPSTADLALMRRMDELHLDFPFA